MFKYLDFRILLFLVFYFLFDASFAQQKIATLPAAKPSGFKLFFEKVYLQTDRNLYTSGEDLWFKAYLVNGLSTSLTNTSNNLYVELIAADTKIINREIIRMDNGLGNGDFKLNDALTSGNYRLRAYTNWMRNFGDNFVFEKTITIQQVSVSGKTAVQLNKKTSVKIASAENTNGIIRFFPEGGSLIQDVQSLIGFKAEQSGNGLKVNSGSIISSKGDTISRFQSAASGMGSFAFLPLAGLQYQVKGVFSNNQNFTQALPAALPKGFSLHLNVSDTANITATISLNAATLTDFLGKEITLAGRHGAKLCFSAKIKINGLETNVKIPGSSFPAGVAAITLYDEQLRPNCERLFYMEKNECVTLSILPDKKSYQPKEEVVLHLKTTNAAQKPVSANLSLAALDAAILPDEQRNIQSYFLLESEVRGKIANAAHYFESSNPNRFRQLDLLLLTQGWRDFVWKRLADTAINISYLPEQGFTLTGRLRDRLADKPQPNMNISLFAPGAKDDKLFMTKTATDGKYFLDGLKFYGNQNIKLSAYDDKGKKTGWIFLDTILSKSMTVQAVWDKPVTDPEQLVAFNQAIEKRKLNNSLNDTLQLKGITITENARTVVLRDQVVQSFGYPDQIFDIEKKDFYFETLDNWLIHNVKGAIVNPSLDTNGVVFYSQGKRTFPRFIVQGREDVFERLDYYLLPMDVVKHVTVRHLVGLGADVFLIYLILKPEAFEKMEFYLINANLNGYYEAREFYMPKNSISNTNLHTTLFWEPNIITDTNGEATIRFTNASQKTQIKIIAEGITARGVAVTGKTIYAVK